MAEEILEEEVVEEEVVGEEVEVEEEAPVEVEGNKGKKVRRGIAGGLVVLTIVAVAVTLIIQFSHKRPVVEEPDPEEKIEDVITDKFKEETGVKESSMAVKEGETLPWFVTVNKDAEGNESYNVNIVGDYNQFINVVEPVAGNESGILRTIVSFPVSKDAVEAGTSGINEAIKNAKKEDFVQLCAYNVDSSYEKAASAYCSSLYSNVEGFDWDSARLLDVNNATSLTGSAYIMEDDGQKSIAVVYNFIDANGNVLTACLGSDPYKNAQEKKRLTNIVNGTAELENGYTAEAFGEFKLLDEEKAAYLNENNPLNTYDGLSGSYYEPVKDTTQEPETPTEEATVSQEGTLSTTLSDGSEVLISWKNKKTQSVEVITKSL